MKEKHKKSKKRKQRQKRIRKDRSYSERVRAKWFCYAFKLGFLQLLCKASLIFKSNLELALSIVLKQRELYELKHVPVECTCLKIRDLLSFLICSSILSFIMTTSFANIARTTVCTSKLYTKNEFKSLGIGPLYEQ